MHKKRLITLISLLFITVYGCSKDDKGNEPSTNACDLQLEQAVVCQAVTTSCDERLKESVQCLGNTAQNKRCLNKTHNLCGYCHLHTSQAPAEDPVKCQNMTKNACGYCDTHKHLAE